MNSKHDDKCTKCGTTDSKKFWDFDDNSTLCNKCYNEIGDKWENRNKNYVP